MDQKKVVEFKEDGRHMRIEMDVVTGRVAITEELDGDKETVTITSSETFSVAVQLMELKQNHDFMSLDTITDELKDGSV